MQFVKYFLTTELFQSFIILDIFQLQTLIMTAIVVGCWKVCMKITEILLLFNTEDPNWFIGNMTWYLFLTFRVFQKLSFYLENWTELFVSRQLFFTAIYRIKSYRKQAKWTSKASDISQTARRYYSNTLCDQEKQNTMNVFLGTFRPSRCLYFVNDKIFQ